MLSSSPGYNDLPYAKRSAIRSKKEISEFTVFCAFPLNLGDNIEVSNRSLSMFDIAGGALELPELGDATIGILEGVAADEIEPTT